MGTMTCRTSTRVSRAERLRQAGVNCATGITTYLENGGTLEPAQTIANHESPRTTKLYDYTREELSTDEIGRMKI